MLKKMLLGSALALALGTLGALEMLAPTVAAAEEGLDFSRFKAPACEQVGGTCAGTEVVTGDSLTDFLSDPATQEPINLQGDTWTEYRWVYNGCCTSIAKTKYKQQRRTCSCCYVTPPTVRCGPWSDTGTIKCENNCML